MKQNKDWTNQLLKRILHFIKEVLSSSISGPTIGSTLSGISFLIGGVEISDRSSIDERLQRLGSIKTDLQASILAVEELEIEASKKKREVDELESVVKRLNEDKTFYSDLLHIPEEALARILSKATSKGRLRGFVEGIFIGLVTGTISSYAVWYFTTPKIIP